MEPPSSKKVWTKPEIRKITLSPEQIAKLFPDHAQKFPQGEGSRRPDQDGG